MSSTAVSIVIPFRNSEQTIALTLDSLAMQRGIDSVEIIGVDDHSTDDTIKIIKTHPISESHEIRIIANDAGGLANAYNIGWRAAKNEFIVFMHSDCYVLADDALKKVCGYLKSGEFDGIQPLTLLPEEVWGKMSFWDRVGKSRYVGKESHGFGGKFDGIRRSTLESIGGFDAEHFYSAAEDSDIFYRMIEDYKFINSDIRVVHNHIFPKNTRVLSLLKKQAQLAQGYGAVLRKHLPLVFKYPRFFKMTMIHMSKGVLIIGLFFPQTFIPAAVILMLYAILYSWRALCTPDIRIILVPFVNILQFAVFSFFCLTGFLLGRQTFYYK